MENQEQEAKDGYPEIFLCEWDHPTLEPATCRNLEDSPLLTKCFRKRVRRVINVVN
jgi:hypothetical protein